MQDTSTMTDCLLAAGELWKLDADTGEPTRVESFYADGGPLAGVADQAHELRPDHPVRVALKTGEPRVCHDLSELGFIVKEAAELSGVSAALLLPSYDGDAVASVLLLFLRGGDDHRGAIELWAGTRGRFELSLSDGYYAGLERLERISAYVNFPKGAGLPGVCWETSLATIVPDVAKAKGFLRSAGQGDERLTVGLGLPLIYRTELRAVLLLLSTVTCPVARVQEVWVMDPDQPGRLVRSQGVYGGQVPLAEASRDVSFAIGQGLVGHAWASGEPVMRSGEEALASLGGARVAAAREASLCFALAIPIRAAGEVRSVAVLLG